MPNEIVARAASLVEPLLTCLEVTSPSRFQLFPSLVDCGIGTQGFHRVSNGDGLMHQTVVDV